jgi:hypothetical protein
MTSYCKCCGNPIRDWLDDYLEWDILGGMTYPKKRPRIRMVGHVDLEGEK